MRIIAAVSALLIILCAAGCSSESNPETTPEEVSEPVISSDPYTRDTRISEVINDPVFGNYGRLIFPVDDGYYNGETLGDLSLTWYNNIDPDKTVEIANYMRSHAESGDVIFYDIYSDAEKAAESRKREKKIRDCFSSKENRARSSRFAARAAALRMWEPCTTAFRTLWNCQSAATTPLR